MDFDETTTCTKFLYNRFLCHYAIDYIITLILLKFSVGVISKNSQDLLEVHFLSSVFLHEDKGVGLMCVTF